MCVASSCRCCQPTLPLPSSKSRPVFKKRKGAAPAFQYIHYDGPTQCFTKAFVDSIHHIRVYCAIPSRDNICKRQLFRVCCTIPPFFSFFAIRHIIDYGWCLVWGKKKIKRKKWNPPSARRRRRRHLICNSLRNHFSFPIEIQCRFHLKSIVCLRRNGDHESQATEQIKNTPRTSRKIHRKRVV